MTDAPPPVSQGEVQLSRSPDGALVVQIVESGQTRVLQIPATEAKGILWQAIVALSAPSDPPPQPLPGGTEGMPLVQDTVWMAGPMATGAHVALWIPGLGFCGFTFTQDSAARLGAFLVQAAQLAEPAPSLAKN